MATDLSENARYAFSYAADIAARYNAGIVILHVLEDVPSNIESDLISMVGEKEWRELKEKHEKDVVSSMVGKRSEYKLIRMALGSLDGRISDELLPDAD